MNLSRFLLVCGTSLGAMALVVPVAHAQNYGPVAGESEVTLSGTGGSDNDFDTSTLGLSGSYGYYATDNLLVGVRQGVNLANTEGGDDSINGRTLGFAQYHFGQARFRPFIGLNLGGIYGDNVSDTFAAGPEAGVKYYADRNTFVFGLVEYQVVFDELSGFDDSFDDGNFAYTVGIGFNF